VLYFVRIWLISSGYSFSIREEKIEVSRRSCYFILCLFLLSLFLFGCPKKVARLPPIEAPPVENPIVKLLEAFSSAESLQARASIRIEAVRSGQEMNFLLNGFVLYQRPDRLRLLGYHPFGMGLFDALYRNGEFFLLVPPQKKAYAGEVSQFDDLMEKAGAIQILTEKGEGNEIPNRIRIDLAAKETRIDIRLKEILINPSMPEESFQWVVPEGIEVQPLSKLLRKKLR
jgi:outer membrane lipoprotein-sorting protein